MPCDRCKPCGLDVDSVVVTGATGFIGTNLTTALLKRGCQVRAITRSRAGASRASCVGIDVHSGDLADEDFVRSACRDVSHVFHLAGVVAPGSQAEADRVNVTLTGRLAAALARLTRPPVLVHVSSLAAAGPADPRSPKRESDVAEPRSCYGRSKLAAERLLRTFADRLRITVVRPPAVFGAWDRNLLEFHRAVRWRINPVVISRRFCYSIVHVADLVQGLLAAAEQGARLTGSDDDSAGVYFVADPTPISMPELAAHVAASVGRPAPVSLLLPAPLCWTVAGAAEAWGLWSRRRTFFNLDKMREASAGSWVCDPTRARVELGFTVGGTLAERIAETTAWYRGQGWI